MNPEVVYSAMIREMELQYTAAAYGHAKELREWLNKGGSLPMQQIWSTGNVPRWVVDVLINHVLEHCKSVDIDDFTGAYIDAALWSSTEGENDTPLDDKYDQDSIAPETLREMVADCQAFQGKHGDLLTSENCHTRHGSAKQQAGHDFWLTRNGHGAGFWDTHDWAAVAGEVMTEYCKSVGEYHLYVDGDLIYGGKG